MGEPGRERPRQAAGLTPEAVNVADGVCHRIKNNF
ncbi:hypothetical protein DFAR_2910051 [Desulfarculales bacterium]